MKYLKLFEGFSDIKAICREYGITNYTINSDGSIDVDRDVDLNGGMDPYKLDKLPLKFNRVQNSFYCSYNKLTSLEGAPKSVGYHFNCYYNQLKTLEGGPSEVGGNFKCGNNQLTSLKGAPKSVGGHFDCRFNILTTLEGAPKEIGGDFNCSNTKITSLEGSPKSVGGHFDCKNNQLTSLEGAPKEIGGYFCWEGNPLPKLITYNNKYIKEIVKWQDEYNIWRDGKLDEFRFGEMMIDIKNEVGS